MAAFSSIALGVGALAAAAGAYQGVEAERTQRQARYRQRDAQDEALRQQLVERRRAVQAEMASNRPTPASSIALGDEILAQTDRTGGLDDRLRLARPSKLGGG